MAVKPDILKHRSEYVQSVMLRPQGFVEDDETYFARQIIRSYTAPDAPLPIYSGGILWAYANGCWHKVHRDSLLYRIGMFASQDVIGANGAPRRIKLGATKRRGIMDCVYMETARGDDPFASAEYGICFKNGFLKADPLRRTLEFVEHSPDHMAQWQIDCDYRPLSDVVGGLLGSYTDKLLNGLFGNDSPEDRAEKVAALLEFTFASMSGLSTYAHRALFLVGLPGRGKSQFLNMVSSMFPKEAICSVTPQNMEHEYYGAELAGAGLNVVHELKGDIALTDDSTFKAAVSGDFLTRRRIYGAPFRFAPRCGHLYGANRLPLAPFGQAFYDRVLVANVTGANYRESDERVPEIGKLIAQEELELVCALVCHYGIGFMQRGGYTIPRDHVEAVRNWRHSSDPISAFIDEECEILDIDSSARTWETVSDAYSRFAAWSRGCGLAVKDRNYFKQRLCEVHGIAEKRSNGTRVAIRRRVDDDAT